MDHAQQELVRRGVPLPLRFSIHADCTCREQRNTTAMTQAAWFTGTVRFRSTTVTGMGKGHSHIDLDQRFSDLSTNMKYTDVMQDTTDVVSVINQKVHKKRNREIVAELAPVSHDWKAYFDPLGIVMHGHTNNDAAHVHKFLQRRDLVQGGLGRVRGRPWCVGVGVRRAPP